MDEKELQLVAQRENLSHTKVQELLSQFGQYFGPANELAKIASAIVVTDESQADVIKQARTTRLELKNIRVKVEHTRKELKEESLREGKAIDGLANVIKALIVPVEEHLEKQEKFAEVREAERKAVRYTSRVKYLAPYVEDVSVYSLTDIDNDAFDRLVAQAKEAKAAKERAEAEAEAERQRLAKEAAQEQERIRAENERLKQEAQAREAELAEERRKVAEKEAGERAAAQAKADAEHQATEDKRRALLAPDREKLLKFADTLDGLEFPTVADDQANEVLTETRDFLSRITKNLRKKAAEL